MDLTVVFKNWIVCVNKLVYSTWKTLKIWNFAYDIFLRIFKSIEYFEIFRDILKSSVANA